MKHSLNDFDADVRDIAGQLSAADFSAQSQQREDVRAQLIDQAETLHNPSPPLRSRLQPRGRLYAIMGTLAASLMVGIVFLMQAKAPAPMTEMILPVTPAAQPTDIPLEMLPRFYDTLEYAAAAVQKPLFAPSDLPEGYSLSFAALSSPAMTVRIMTSVYVEKEEVKKMVLKGVPDSILVDYLYIAQELTNEEDHLPQWNFPSNFQREESKFFTADSQWSSTSYTRGTATAGDYHIVIWPKDGYTFHLASRVMSYEELQRIAESLKLFPDTVFSPVGPGSCDISGPGEGSDLWTLPLPKDSYTNVRGFWNGHSGVDLEAPLDTPVFAASDGTVIYAGWSDYGYGNTIVISHGDMLTMYAQLKEISVGCGEVVTLGQTIGGVGSSGNSSGPHLHFEMITEVGGMRIDPAEIFDF